MWCQWCGASLLIRDGQPMYDLFGRAGALLFVCYEACRLPQPHASLYPSWPTAPTSDRPARSRTIAGLRADADLTPAGHHD